MLVLGGHFFLLWLNCAARYPTKIFFCSISTTWIATLNPHEHAMLRRKARLNMTRYGNLRRGKRRTMTAMFIIQFKDASGNPRCWDHDPAPAPLAVFVPRISYQTPHMKKPLLQSLSLIRQVTSPA